MSTPYDFKKFQQELDALEGKAPTKPLTATLSKKEQAALRLTKAKADFLTLKEKYSLTIAEAVSLFPEEDGVGYLRELLAASEEKPKRGRPKRS
jgi:hypothetical protein